MIVKQSQMVPCRAEPQVDLIWLRNNDAQVQP